MDATLNCVHRQISESEHVVISIFNAVPPQGPKFSIDFEPYHLSTDSSDSHKLFMMSCTVDN